MKTITIIGAGLAGTLLSLYLARRGYAVEVYEARSDIRNGPEDAGRSINLALSCRGITGLAGVGLMKEIENIMVPMRARAIHEQSGDISYQAFGRHHDEYINAILRSKLNALLLNATSAYPKIQIQFDTKLQEVNFQKREFIMLGPDGEKRVRTYHHLIGTDGAPSAVRESLKNENLIESKREFLPHGYKELSISRGHGVNMVREHLHLWPRDAFMLLGNPNKDDSITGSLFLPTHGEYSFDQLTTEESLTKFFNLYFADVYPAMPNLLGEFFSHPTGNLSTVQCYPWYYQDNCLLLGDAAHGIVPFFGQGMNSSFEDCRMLNEVLDQCDDDWEKAMPAFFSSRKINTDAVAEMSMDNYQEIQHNIRDAKFNLKKQVEQELMHRYPNRYVSKHVLVMFTNIPYAEALAHGRIQATFLEDLCADVDTVEEMDWKKVDKAMVEYDKKLANH
jgi:kynurenine 3-monooxygenase